MYSEIGLGIECYVHETGVGTVYKDYRRLEHISYGERVRYTRICFELQSIAAEQGLAPKVYYLADTGYYCEKVALYEELTKRNTYQEERVALCKDIDELFGGHWFDNHPANFGILVDGRLCVIDFGLCGFVQTDTGKRLKEKHGITRY